MKPRFLFPSAFRYLGYLLATPGLILGYLILRYAMEIPGFGLRIRNSNELFSGPIENFTNELALSLVIVGLILIAFSKVKREDELTARIRLYALNWALLVNYGLYIIVSAFVLFCIAFNITVTNGLNAAFKYYIDFSMYNLFTPLIIFIVIFYYLLYRNKNEFKFTPVRYLPYKPFHFLGKWSSLIILLLLAVACTFHIGSFETVFIILPVSMLLWVFSKEKAEDEFIESIRLEAMQVAVYVNYGILLILNLLIYGLYFRTLIFLNLITIPLIFVCWFRYKIYLTTKDNNFSTTLS